MERPSTHGSEAFGPFLVGYTLFSAGREAWHGDFGAAALNLATLIEPVGVVVALGQARQSWRTGHGVRALAEAATVVPEIGPVVAVGLVLYPALEWAAGQAASSEVLRPLVSPRVRFDAWGGGFQFLP